MNDGFPDDVPYRPDRNPTITFEARLHDKIVSVVDGGEHGLITCFVHGPEELVEQFRDYVLGRLNAGIEVIRKLK